MKDGRLCIFGEVLFDNFPDGQRVLGGAPFNVAWHLQAFGESPHLISRVGDDPDGESVRAAMRAWGMDRSGLQTDPERPTGRVDVRLAGGEPAYEIVHPCAYDAIATEAAVTDCRLLYHGSLALREATPRQTLEQLKACKPKTVFVDVNLRPPWWHKEQILDMLRMAHWVKLNTDELTRLNPSDNGGTPRAADFLAEFQLSGLVLTHGAKGAEILTADGEHFEVRPDQGTAVVDTVGAGDAFASVIILGLSNEWPLDLTLQRAQMFASKIVGNRGATIADMAFYKPIINEWRLGV